jgi:transketolase
MDKKKEAFLKQKITWVWQETLRIHKRSQETRLASSLSPIEIFVALFYGKILDFDPGDQYWEGRDRLIVSKGHGSIAMYPILADLGFFAKEELQNVGQSGSFIGGIPDPVIPGYETVNGSLGHGLGVSCGIAIALKRKKSSSSVFCMVGDGELYEGSNWEALMFAPFHRLDNLNLVLDCNKISMLDYTDRILSHFSLKEKFGAFRWQVSEVDGHDVTAVYDELRRMKQKREGTPKILIAHTLKGKGVPGLEGEPLSHIKTIEPGKIDRLLGDNNDQ